jgi:septum formation protein
VLASTSPRRRQLLSEAGYRFETADPPDDDALLPVSPDPADIARQRSEHKARGVARLVPPGVLILACDTVVADGADLLGKPADRADAERMIRRLAGREQAVVSAVTLLDTADGRERTAHAESRVAIDPPDPARLAAFLDGADGGFWKGKAGGYGIQDADSPLSVRLVAGSLSNVIGLPMELLADMLAERA